MEKNFDVVVIGGGPGGYVCAIRLAQLGLNTACVESRGTLGGTCLNVGCIPSKSLLNLSEKYYEAKKDFNNLGIELKDINLNLSKIMNNKKKSVLTLTKGVEFLFKKNKVTYIKGKGSISSKNNVSVVDENGKKTNYQSKNIVISTGSVPISPSNIKIDEQYIVSSTGALSFDKVPKELIIVGGGYIGLEMGSIWKRLGSNVTIIEFADHIIPGMDKEISIEFLKILKKQGINFELNSKVTAASVIKNKVVVDFTNNKIKKIRKEGDKVLLALGRKSNIEGLNLKELGIQTDKHDKIIINDKFQTSIKNIYAIGDVIAGPMLAHKAEEEGIAVAEIITGQAGHVNYKVIPSVIYTHPEVAAVGKTEEQLKEENIKYKVGKFPFLANSRAKINNEADGFVKIIADEQTDKILGVHMIGPHVGNMIAEICVAMEFGASSEDIARTCHAHPTHTEAIKEAALAVDKRPIHF